MVDAWHSQFDPKQFLSTVNIDSFIERNEVYNENKIDVSHKSCILCNNTQGSGLLLNDKTYLCKACFDEVSTITYPEEYERLHRNHIRDLEARRNARDAFIQNCSYRKLSSLIVAIGWISLLLLFVKLIFIVAPIASYLIYHAILSKHEKRIAEWESVFTSPREPQLRHFHDSSARLTQRDLSILKIFNNWPGYPPFWSYLRQVVLTRDGNRCQVSGCPSRVELHIHHKVPVSQGGEHVPTNLLSLCVFHHALEPSEGHERIWGNVKTRYFTMVQAHKRRNSSTSGYHSVCAHVRRLELVDKPDLSEIIDFYGLSCPSCGSMNLRTIMNKKNQQVSINCLECSEHWIGPRKLCEETGPRIAEVLTVTKNKGCWGPRWDMLETRADSVFHLLKNAKSKPKKRINTITSKNNTIPKCPKCGNTMHLIKPRSEQHWKAFWGCTKYRTIGCKGSRKA